ncbi:hypothetical protein D3C86_1947560 [compost metagenome]
MSNKFNMVEQWKSETCCGGPDPTKSEACCSEDANAKAAGQDGCGCESDSALTKIASSSCC